MNWFRLRYRTLRWSINSAFTIDGEVKEEAVAATIQRILWTAPVMAVSHFVVALGFWFQGEATLAGAGLWRDLIITTNFIVSLGNFVLGFIAWLMKKKGVSVKVQTVFSYIVVIYVLAMGLTLTQIDQLVMSNITPFLIAVTIVGTFYYLPPKNSFMVFFVSFVLFSTHFLFYADLPINVIHSNVINGLVISSMGFALSFVSWQHFHRTTLQQRTIAQQQGILRQMAYHDSLTHLPNRRYLDELVKREVALVQRQQVKSCLIICDIDRFKQVNDTYGHLAGDDLLREFAELLQANLRKSNSLVRLGGEEFVILAPSTSLEQCSILAERLRTLVEGHGFEVDGNKVRITASFGVAALQGTEGARDYYSRADRALYQAKQAGRNQVVIARCEAAC